MGGDLGHDGREEGDDGTEKIKTVGANALQSVLTAILLGDNPRSLLVYIAIGLIGKLHHRAYGISVIAGLIACDHLLTY